LVSQGGAQGLWGTPCGWWKHGGSTDGITILVTRPCAVATAVMIRGGPRGGVAAARPPPTRPPEALSAMSAGAVLDGRFRASGRSILLVILHLFQELCGQFCLLSCTCFKIIHVLDTPGGGQGHPQPGGEREGRTREMSHKDRSTWTERQQSTRLIYHHTIDAH